MNGNFRASDSSTNVLDFSNGVTLSSKGFGSVRGTVELSGTSSNIGVLRKGVVLVSAVNRFNEAIDHAASMVLAYSATDAPVEIGSNIAAGAASITFDTGNIVMNGDSDTTYDYNITYFPLP